MALTVVAPPLAGSTLPAMAVSQTHSPNFGTKSVGQVEVPLTATGGDGVNYAWSLVGGALPPGIAIRTDLPTCCFPGTASAGLIGIATTPGTYNFTLRVTSGIDIADVPSTMKISALAVKDINSLPDAFVGTGYSYTLTALGNAGALTWTPTGALPAGLSLSTAGVLSGNPTTPGSFITVGVSLTDGTDTITRFLTLTVSAINISAGTPLAPGVLPNATQTVPYSGSVIATGGTGGYTYTASGLPSGLSINSSTGAITGTISSSTFGIGRSAVSVTAKDSSLVSYTKSMSIDVLGAVAVLPTVSPSGFALETCAVGVPCSRTINVTNGGAAPFAWSVSGLPPGMTIRTGSDVTSNGVTPGDGEIWGAPTATGLFNVQVMVTDATGATASNTFPLRVSTILQTNSISTGGNLLINTPFSRTLRVIGGTLPYTVANTNFPLPAGVTLNTTTMVASGTPTESGSFSVFLVYSDAGGPAQTYQVNNFVSVTSAGSGAVSINTSASLGFVTTGSPYTTSLSASGAGGITWSVIGGALPTGVSLSSGGAFSGTASVSGQYTFLVKAVDNGNAANFAVRQFTLNVTPMNITSPFPLPYGNVGTLYTQVLTATGGTGASTWTLQPFAYPPPGLTLASDGTLSGTPTAKGQYSVSVIVTDTASHTRSTSLSLSIYLPGEAPPVFQTQSSNFGTRSMGQVELPLSASGGNGTNLWTLQGGALPPGIAIRTDKPTSFQASASAGLIGVATTPGTYNFTLRVASSGTTFDQVCTLKITALTVKDQSTLPDAYVGTAYSYTLTPLGNAGAVTFTPTGNMPASMSLSSAGVLSGTPTTAANNFNIGYSVNDGTDTVTRSVNLTISAISVTSTGALAPGVLPNATQNVAYSTTITAAGGAGGFTFTASGVPSGLTLNGATGVISGTLSNSSSQGKVQVTVTAKDSLNVSYAKTMSLTVVAPLVALPAVTPSGSSWDGCTLGVPCSRTAVVQSGGVAPFAWVASGLPPGMTMRTGGGVTSNGTTPGDAELWGTPTAPGLFNVQVTVTDATGATATNTFPLRVSTLLQTTSLSNGGSSPINSPFNRPLRVIGGTLPYTVAQVSGVMSSGVTLNTSTLVASGTPVESGSFSPRLVYTDAGGPAQTLQATNSYTISGAGTGISINTSASLGSTFLGNVYSNNLSASGAGSITWSLIGGALPNGVTLAPNGVLSGATTAAGLFTFLLQATDTNNSANFGARQFTLNVTPISFTIPSPLPYGNVGTAYSQALTANGATGTKTWTLADFSYLPPGLSLASDGTLSGTPTATGLYSFTVIVADTANHNRSTTLTLSIYGNGIVPAVGQTQAANFGTKSIGYLEMPLTAAGGNGSYVWSLQSGSLPAGMAIRTDKPSSFPGTASAGLSGVPTTPGNYSFTLRVTSGGQTSDQASTLKITALTVKDLNQVPDAFVGTAYSYTLTALGNAGPVTWTPTSGMPAGMSLSTAGVLSGTPTSGINTNINFTLTDGTDTVSRSVNIQVSPIKVSVVGALAPGVFPNATHDVPYSATVTASGGSGGYTFTADGLPIGLSLNATTGVISGTVPAVSTVDYSGPGLFSVFVTATDSSFVSSTMKLSLDVMASSPMLPAIYTFGSPWDDCTIGTSCDRGATAAVGTAPFAWTVTGLPAGMSYRTANGVMNSYYGPGEVQLWGTPTVTGVFSVVLTVTDATGATATNTFPLSVSALVQTNFLQDANLNSPYVRSVRIVGGSLPYGAATQTNVELPLGLSFNTSTFVVSGTPTESGDGFSTLVTFTDGGIQTLRLREYLRVNGAGNGSVSLENIGHVYLTTGVFVSGGLGACCANPVVVTQIGGTTPPGLTFFSDGSVSGTPTTPGDYTFKMQATDGQNAANFGVRQYTFTVTSLNLTNGNLPFGNVGTPYTQAFTVTGGTGTLTFTLAPFSYLPPGVMLGANGVFSGTPTASGQYAFVVVVSDQGGSTLMAEVSLSIYPPGMGPAPGTFGKLSPPNGSVVPSLVPTLTWGTSAGAATYEYCIDTTNNNACDSSWVSVGNATSVGLTGLTANTSYYWHVRSVSGGGTTYADGGSAAFWGFTARRSPLVDLNGDGSGDAFLYDPTTGYWSRQISQPGGGFGQQSESAWSPNWQVFRADFNGDALTDVFLHNASSGLWFKLLNDGTGYTTEASGYWWPGWQKFVLDLNGDGISDLFLYDSVTGQWYKALSIPGGFTYATGYWTPNWEITPMNLNGDAFDDLFLIDRTTGQWYWVYGEAGPGFTYPQVGYWAPDWALYPGDFNGDGKGDLFLYRPTAGQYYVALNNGAGYDYTAGYGWAAGWTPYVGDFDGDGKDDLFLYSAASGVWFEMISNGTGGFSVGGNQTWTTGWQIYRTDFNGDGRTDFLLYDPISGFWYQARNLVTGAFSYSSGFWPTGLQIFTRTPIR